MPSEAAEFGRWWLPGAQESSVPGRLSYGPERGYELKLDGCLGWEQQDDVRRLSPRDKPYEVINGDCGLGEVTLLDGIQTWLGGNLSRPTETVTGSRLLLGTLFDSLDDVGGIEARARLRNGVCWANPGGLSTVESDRYFRMVASERTVNRRMVLSDGTELRVEQLLGAGGDGIRELTVTQDVHFAIAAIDGTIQHVDLLLDRLGDVADLVTIGVGENALFDSVEVLHPEVPMLNINHQRMGDSLNPIRLVANWRSWTEPGPEVVHPSVMLFRAQELSDDHVRSWMTFMSEHRLIVRNLVGMRHTTASFVDDRIRTWTAALSDLEKVISRRPNSARPSFRSQLLKVAELVGSPFRDLVGDVDPWSTEVRDVRHATAHTTRERSGAVERRYFLAESLYWLAVAGAMLQAGMPRDLVERLFTHRSVRHVGQRLRSA